MAKVNKKILNKHILVGWKHVIHENQKHLEFNKLMKAWAVDIVCSPSTRETKMEGSGQALIFGLSNTVWWKLGSCDILS